jgi:pimeloyl-ACP methyl ester carboxylesterase
MTTRSSRRPFRARAFQWWFTIGGALAPEAVERQAATLMLTPLRKFGAKPRTPLHPEGAAGSISRHAFTLDSHGLRLAVWSWGAGPAVLLVHGWQGSAAQMAPMAAAIAAAGYRAVMFDLPAHGQSAGKTTSIPECARAVHAVADAVGSIHGVVGHSFGATSAIFALSEGLEAKAAVLLAPAIGPMPFIDRFTRFVGLPQQRVPGMLRQLEERVGVRIGQIDARRVAPSLRLPALVIHDREDNQVAFSQGEELVRLWPSASLIATDGLGHARMLKDPDTIRVAVDFIRRQTNTSS